MNAVAKRGANRLSRGMATKPAMIMPAMNTSKDRWRRGSTAWDNGRWRIAASSKYSRFEQIAIQDEEGGEPYTGEERQRQHGEVDEEGESGEWQPYIERSG